MRNLYEIAFIYPKFSAIWAQTWAGVLFGVRAGFPVNFQKANAMLNIRHNHLTVVLFAASIFISFQNVDTVGAQQTALEPIVSLTAEEREWLAAHPDIELAYTDVFEPEVIANPDGSYRGILIDFLEAGGRGGEENWNCLNRSSK